MPTKFSRNYILVKSPNQDKLIANI
uniref:Uncharacterized protein n=1 Tax=Arundo donax TaxID=35708 RepID=A0A0A9AGV5_ARUDO